METNIQRLVTDRPPLREPARRDRRRAGTPDFSAALGGNEPRSGGDDRRPAPEPREVAPGTDDESGVHIDVLG